MTEDDIDPISFASDRCDECGLDEDEIRLEERERTLALIESKIKGITKPPEVPSLTGGYDYNMWNGYKLALDELKTEVSQ